MNRKIIMEKIPGQSEHVRAISNLQVYIEDHINDDISLHDLASRAGYSPWHTAKIFKDITGKSPFDYIRGLRLTNAALNLRDKDIKVIDAALDFMFDSHEGFTRAFKRQFGITPKDYKKTAPPIKLFKPWPVQDYFDYTKLELNDFPPAEILSAEIMSFPARKMILKKGYKATNYFEYSNELNCDIWGILISVKEALYEPVGMWLPENLRPEGASKYAQGVEVPIDYNNIIPDGFEIIELPACQMLMFQGEPFRENEFDFAIQSLINAIDAYDPGLSGCAWADETAPRIQLEPQGFRGYMEARPVKLLTR